MPSNDEEPQEMVNFILNNVDAEDEATASMIQPLPASVRPSAEFLSSTRARILSVVRAEAGERRAA